MLSGGMKQRVAIARGMAMEPDILLMDEPFAALDALTRRKMQDELLALWDETRFTVLFVTHSIPEAIKIGNRILLLSPHPGQVKAEINGVSRGEEARCAAARTLGQAYPRHAVRRRGGNVEDRAMADRAAAPRRTSYREPLRSQATFGVVEKPLTLRRAALATRPGCASSCCSSLLALALGSLCAASSTIRCWFRPSPTPSQRFWHGHRGRRSARARAWYSIKVLLMGYAAGARLAALLTVAGDHHAGRHRPARDADRRCSTRCRRSRCCRWR